jgi:glyoxylase-like metal-dependent hydrolase (beta-lactamase superfamily II)
MNKGIDSSGIDAVYALAREQVPGNEAVTGGVRDVVPGVRGMSLRTPTLPPATHTTCYLLGPSLGSGPLVVVDPASPYPDEVSALLAVLDGEAEAGRPVGAVFLTHHHGDHVAAATVVAGRYQVPIVCHPATQERLGIAASALGDHGELVAGEVIWRAIFTPGHAPGHLCLWQRDRRTVIAGDMVAGVGTILIDPSDGDMGQYLASLERLLALGPRWLLPAHGPVIDDGPGKLREYLAHRRGREQRVLAALGTASRSLDELTAEGYLDTPRALWPLAARSLVSHLRKLAADGLVVEERGWRLGDSG